MPPSHRTKSTDQIRRRPVVGGQPVEERVVSPQERRRQMMINIGVWFLVLAFSMTSGIMCFSIGGQEKQMAEAERAQQVDPIQSEIDRWEHDVSTNPTDPVVLANCGYYWLQKAEQLKQSEAKPQKTTTASPSPAASPVNGQVQTEKPKVTSGEAFAKAKEFLERAVAADKKYLFAIQTLAQYYQTQGNTAEARKLYEEVLTLCNEPIPADQDVTTVTATRNKQKADATMSLASLEATDKNYSAALSRLDNLIKEQPGVAEAYMLKGSIHQNQGSPADIDEALAAYESAAKIAEGMNEPEMLFRMRVLRAGILKERGDKAGARKEYEAVKAFVGGNPQVSAIIDNMIKQLDAPAPSQAAGKAADNAAAQAAPNARTGAPAAEPAANAEAAAPATEPAPNAEAAAPATEPAPNAEAAAPAAEPAANTQAASQEAGQTPVGE